MKGLREYLGVRPLKGKTETITASELRARIGECLDLVNLGMTLPISRKGKIVAMLVPPTKEKK